MTAVVDAIRSGIIAGDLAPGQRLIEEEICKKLGASRGTVRSALAELINEGLVERVTKGVRVRLVDLQEALEIAEVRLMVETLCVTKAAQKITDEEIRQLRRMGKQLQECAERNDIDGFAALTHQIFETYVRIAGQTVAGEMLERLRTRSTRHRFRLIYRKGRAKVAAPFWLDIIEAICQRDPAAARRALRRHANNVQEAMMALAQEDTPFARHAPVHPGPRA
jgi:DNA-binding GntR family transcriptional regulator